MDLALDPSDSISGTDEGTILSEIAGTPGTDSVVTAIDRTPHSECSLHLQLLAPSPWLEKFRQEPSVGRSVMLIQLLESFADGAEGVQVSFEIQ